MNRFINKSEAEIQSIVEYYDYFIELSGIKDKPLYSDEIAKYVGKCGRNVRHMVEDIMHLYMMGYLDKMIIGTKKGYIYTDDRDLILKVLKSREKQWKSMCYNCYHLMKKIYNQDNVTIDEYINYMFEDNYNYMTKDEIIDDILKSGD